VQTFIGTHFTIPYGRKILFNSKNLRINLSAKNDGAAIFCAAQQKGIWTLVTNLVASHFWLSVRSHKKPEHRSSGSWGCVLRLGEYAFLRTGRTKPAPNMPVPNSSMLAGSGVTHGAAGVTHGAAAPTIDHRKTLQASGAIY
jgi:hypothetical protein